MANVVSTKSGTRGCAFNDRFYFEAISASSSISAEGHSAYDGSGKKYTTEKITSSSNSIDSYTGEIWQFERPPGGGGIVIVKTPVAGTSKSKSSGNVTNTYIYNIDEYGDIYIWMNINMNGNSSSSSNGQDYSLCYPDGGGFSSSTSSTSAGGSYTRIGSLDECTIVLDDNTNCSSSYNYSTTISSDNPNCGTTSNSGNGTDCGFPSFSVNDPNPSATTKLESSETNDTFGCDPGSGFILRGVCTTSSSVNKNANLSQEINEDFLLGKNKQSVDIKLRILETNQPQNCDGVDCGDDCDGDSENCCWSVWNGTSIAAKPVIQKWKTRLRKVDFNDQELQKYIVTVESNYYLEIPVQGSDSIRILVDTGTDTFSGNQNRGSKHEFTNEDFQAQVTYPVYGCINITKVQKF